MRVRGLCTQGEARAELHVSGRGLGAEPSGKEAEVGSRDLRSRRSWRKPGTIRVTQVRRLGGQRAIREVNQTKEGLET